MNRNAAGGITFRTIIQDYRANRTRNSCTGRTGNLDVGRNRTRASKDGAEVEGRNKHRGRRPEKRSTGAHLSKNRNTRNGDLLVII